MSTSTKAPAHAPDCAALVGRVAHVHFRVLLLEEALRDLLAACDQAEARGACVEPGAQVKARKVLGLRPALVSRN